MGNTRFVACIPLAQILCVYEGLPRVLSSKFLCRWNKLIVVCLLRKKVMVKYKGIKGQDEILNHVVLQRFLVIRYQASRRNVRRIIMTEYSHATSYGNTSGTKGWYEVRPVVNLQVFYQF